MTSAIMNTDKDRDELDLIWHQLNRPPEGPDVMDLLRRLVLVTRMQLRRIDELQVEVNQMKGGPGE